MNKSFKFIIITPQFAKVSSKAEDVPVRPEDHFPPGVSVTNIFSVTIRQKANSFYNVIVLGITSEKQLSFLDTEDTYLEAT